MHRRFLSSSDEALHIVLYKCDYDYCYFLGPPAYYYYYLHASYTVHISTVFGAIHMHVSVCLAAKIEELLIKN